MREVLRDEVRRLNPIPEEEIKRSQSGDIIPTKARSPTDCAIRLSPEPRFLLIRHWSLYDSMLHSPYLSTRLHMWSDVGRKRLHKLLAKMGISLQEAARGYMHMDTELKQSLRKRILKFAPQYNLDGLVPGEDGRRGLEGWGFVRSWGWKSTLSAVDIASVVSSILEVGTDVHAPETTSPFNQGSYQPAKSYNARMRALPSPPHSEDDSDHSAADPDYTTNRFFDAYDALDPIATSKNSGLNMLLKHIPTAQYLARAILRTGSALISKKQIRHLRSFRMGVVKEGPDVALFSHPGALVKLAAWVGEAVAVLEAEKGRRKNDHEALVLGCLDEDRGVYVVVGLGSGGAGKKVRSKAEIRERENKKKRKAADKAAKKTERARKRRERKELQRERDEANGLLNSDDEEEEDESDATESEASDSSDDSADDSDGELAQARKKRGHGLNRFGQAFQEVVEETGARVRIDSFEHSVVEVRKEDLAGFLEALSLRSVVG
jgi:cell division control protein 45